MIYQLAQHLHKNMFEWEPYTEMTMESINFFIRQINANRGSDSDMDSDIFHTTQPQQFISGSEADEPTFFTAQQAEESG